MTRDEPRWPDNASVVLDQLRCQRGNPRTGPRLLSAADRLMSCCRCSARASVTYGCIMVNGSFGLSSSILAGGSDIFGCVVPGRLSTLKKNILVDAMNIYYFADSRSVAGQPRDLPDGVTIRPVAENELPALAAMFQRAYGPAVAPSLDEAAAEMTGALGGIWGEFWPEASPAGWKDGELAGAVLTVRRPSWQNAPDCPWLIDVFTDPLYRRTGIARCLISTASRAIAVAGETRVGLTVDDENHAAIALYRSLGFTAT
jgi:N-alpha-acetyltransferase 10/11